MVDVREPKVDDLQQTGPPLSQHVLGLKVPVLNSQVVYAVHLRKQDKSTAQKSAQPSLNHSEPYLSMSGSDVKSSR